MKNSNLNRLLSETTESENGLLSEGFIVLNPEEKSAIKGGDPYGNSVCSGNEICHDNTRCHSNIRTCLSNGVCINVGKDNDIEDNNGACQPVVGE